MTYYPLFLDLRGAQCLMVGAGEVGLRKTQGLLAADPARVLVLDTAPLSPAGPDCPECPACPEWKPLLADPRLVFARRPFSPDDVAGCTLVFAATSSREVNEAVREAAEEARIICNVADDPSAGRFIVPACARHGSLTVAISTAGASPALARLMRRDLDESLCRRYAPLAEVLARLRPLVRLPAAGLLQQAARAALFRAVAESPLADALACGDRAGCEAALAGVLPAALCPHIAELLHELA